jgi:hypothetical protein
MERAQTKCSLRLEGVADAIVQSRRILAAIISVSSYDPMLVSSGLALVSAPCCDFYLASFEVNLTALKNYSPVPGVRTLTLSISRLRAWVGIHPFLTQLTIS